MPRPHGVERLKRGENTSKLHFSADSAVYDKRSATFHRDHFSLSTVDGRIKCDYILPDDPETPPTEYISDEDFEFRMANLQYRDGDWYLHASMGKVEADEESSESESKHKAVLGVDLGVNNLAVASTGRFWSATEFNHWRREYEKRRGMNPTPSGTTTTVGVVGSATEFRVRICTPCGGK